MENDQFEHELMIVKSFFIKEKQKRYISLLMNKKRSKFIDCLAHFKHLDLRHALKIEGHKQKPEYIYEILLEYGSKKTCYVISENVHVDGKRSELMNALRKIVGYGMSSFISCIPGELAYYEGDEVGQRFICLKKSYGGQQQG